MARGAHEIPKKNKFPAWGLILLLLLTLSVGGVTAYLSASSGSLKNVLPIAEKPDITVGKDNSISVPDKGYAVFLRAAVVVNWEKTDEGQRNILAAMPEEGEGKDYTVSVNSNWVKVGDFYYYEPVIVEGGDIPAPVSFQVLPGNRHPEYELKMTVYAQTVQAVGETDGDPKANPVIPPVPAVVDAWNVDLDNAAFSQWKAYLDSNA